MRAWAYGANDRGAIVGNYNLNAFVCTQREGLRDLGLDALIEGPVLGSEAYDINQSGTIIGWYTPEPMSTRPFIWRPRRCR